MIANVNCLGFQVTIDDIVEMIKVLKRIVLVNEVFILNSACVFLLFQSSYVEEYSRYFARVETKAQFL